MHGVERYWGHFAGASHHRAVPQYSWQCQPWCWKVFRCDLNGQVSEKAEGDKIKGKVGKDRWKSSRDLDGWGGDVKGGAGNERNQQQRLKQS